ncbi:hypothetical protein CJF32_00000106 [Rutstroemia sp. NJR-2017a WRK4]|nr:hypothetical protein CJF32_00000106 [Rutstroemia sp. NJR-2017a WRK4]
MAPTATSFPNESVDNSRVRAKGTTPSPKNGPIFESLEEERLYRKFAERGFDEGVAGHITETFAVKRYLGRREPGKQALIHPNSSSSRSVRGPILTDHFWLNPLSQHFSQI